MKKLTLDMVNWKQFMIGDLFEIQIGKVIDGNKIQRENLGKTPYITRKTINNGLDNFIDGYPDDYLFSDVPVITIGNETAKPFVQEFPFYTGTKVNILKPKIQLNRDILLFICIAIEKACDRYSYAYTANSTRLKKQVILLPVDANEQPNWKFMEDYIKQARKAALERLIYYYKQRQLKHSFAVPAPVDMEWKVFELKKIFKKIKRGKRLIKENQIKGHTPYISSTAMNNGVDNFISNKENVRFFKNCLSLANSGSVGACFYHPYEYIASDHVTALELEQGDKYVYLFIATILKRLNEKYSFNREISDSRIQREKILLPVDEKGEPNWEYMRKYIQKLETEIILKILKYFYSVSKN